MAEVAALPSDLVHQLTEKRKTMGLSQEGLADGIGVSNSSLRRWEKRQNNPSLDSVCAWAEELGLRFVLLNQTE